MSRDSTNFLVHFCLKSKLTDSPHFLSDFSLESKLTSNLLWEARAMAAANPVQSLQEEATCSICLEYFTDPVITKCGHHFCRPCVLSACSKGEGTALSCPQCREPCPQGDLRTNRHLQSIVELVKQLSVQHQRPPGEGLSAEKREKRPGVGLCAKHEERLKLFSKEDEKLICVICRESKEHREHMVLPIEEATEEYKPKLHKWLQTLRKELGVAQEGKLKEEENYKDLRNKLEAERKKVETEFQKLQQLLKEQELTLLRRLEEMDKKIVIVENANMAELSAEMSSLEALITEIEKKWEQPAEELLKDIRSTVNRCEQVMEEKYERIKKYKVHVTLDDDTAHDLLTLSEGGRRVRRVATRQGRPDNPKRFTSWPCVLGREGFTSGRHYWELQLLQDGVWAVGVARESVNRKERIPLTPEGGAWTVGGYDGEYVALTSPPSRLSPLQRPPKLGLYLDYEGGRLSVYNADSMEALHTFTGAAFNGRIYPFFSANEKADLRLV